MSRELPTFARDNDAPDRQIWILAVPVSPEALRKASERAGIVLELIGERAGKLAVYAGEWRPEGTGQAISKAGTVPLGCLEDPIDLLEWLEANQADNPIVIEAEIPQRAVIVIGPVVDGALLVPALEDLSARVPDYSREIKKVWMSDDAGILEYGAAWPVVRELAEVEKEIRNGADGQGGLHEQRSQLKQALVNNYPNVAHKLGISNPAAAHDVGVTQAAPAAVQRASARQSGEKNHRAESDRKEMERLLKQTRPDSIRDFCLLLTEIQERDYVLRWGYTWNISRIARATQRSRKTVDESLTFAQKRIDINREASKGRQKVEY